MKKKTRIVLGILLLIIIGNYFRISPNSNIRTVDFISIFAIGALAGVLLADIIKSNMK